MCHWLPNNRAVVTVDIVSSAASDAAMYCIVQIRRYSDFLVAEVGMPAGSGPAGGDGFNELAGYIFGGNTRYILFAPRS